MIKVCDSIMGSGKTQAAISYINEHPDERFIYVAPYLSETERIQKACPDAHFITPTNKVRGYKFSKVNHTASLISEGRNVAVSQSCFTLFTREMLNDIQDKGYVLILDESLPVFEKFKYKQSDIYVLLDVGFLDISEDGRIMRLTEAGYEHDGVCFAGLLNLARCRELIKVDDESCVAYYWSIPISLLTACREVFVLTYLFRGQTMQYYLDLHNVSYSYVGVRKCEDGNYRFASSAGRIPDHVKKIREHLHLFDKQKLYSNFGKNNRYTGSMNWFETHPEDVDQLQRNLYNFFHYYCKDVDKSEFMWTTFAKDKSRMRGKGYSNGFVSHNARASNEYRNRTKLAYLANPFMNVGEKKYFKDRGVTVDEDMYALSILIQWIWRSAIRDGKDVDLYLPMQRLRRVLVNWLDSLDEEVAKDV